MLLKTKKIVSINDFVASAERSSVRKVLYQERNTKNLSGSDMDLTKFHHFNYLLLAPLFVFMY